jgi:GntR family transcriptional regulator
MRSYNYNQARGGMSRRLQTSPHRAYDLIRSGIRAGQLRGDRELAEDSLIRSLSTSRNAVRLALQMLAADGLLDRRQNRGTTIVGEILDVRFDELVPLAAFQSPRASVRELDHRQIEPTPYLLQRLAIEDGMVDVSEVLISVDGQPTSVRVSYIGAQDHPIERVIDIVPFAIAFERVFGVPIGQQEAAIGAVLSGPSTSRLLNVAEGTPVLVEEMLLRDNAGRPRELSYTHHRADRVSLSVNHAVPHLNRINESAASC